MPTTSCRTTTKVVTELTTGRTPSSSLTYATIQRRGVISEPLLTPSLSQHAVATDRSLTSRLRHRAVVSDLSLLLRSAGVLWRLFCSSAAALIPLTTHRRQRRQARADIGTLARCLVTLHIFSVLVN